jgi:hypothetical protein
MIFSAQEREGLARLKMADVSNGKNAFTYFSRQQRNQSWNLCDDEEWAELHMRLGSFAEEICVIMSDNNRSILHEACTSATISPLTVRGIYFACPQALLLQDRPHKRTPLHCALTCVAPDQMPSLDMVCTILDLSQERVEGISEGDDDMEQAAAQIQDSLGETPLHSASRVGASKEIIRALLDACPSALVKYNKEGMTPIMRLWASLQASVGQSKIDSIESWIDLSQVSEVRDAWEKAVMCLQVLTTWQVTDEEEDEEDMTFTEEGSPELCFQILHTIASADCPGELMSLALKLYPKEFLELDDDGQTVLDIAIAQSIRYQQMRQERIKNETSAEQSDQVETTLSSVVDALMRHDKDGSLYKLCEANCCESRPPLHRAILAGKGWSEGIAALCDGDANIPTEADAGTGLYPFMMAATVLHDSTGAPLSGEIVAGTIYELLRRAPELVVSALPAEDAAAAATMGYVRVLRDAKSSGKRRLSVSVEEKASSPQDSFKKIALAI